MQDDLNVKTKPKKENLFINLVFNIVIPSLILSKCSGDNLLGPTWGLIIALFFPLSYGLFDFFTRKKVNIFSILGLASTFLTGTISLMQLPPEYIAIKEAAIPGIIFLAVFISSWTPYPLIEKLLFNDDIFDLAKLEKELQSHHSQEQMKGVLKNASHIVSFSFLFSSVLNFTLAKVIVVSAPGTDTYNAELGKLMYLSYPVIALPCTLLMMAALFYLIHHIQKLTGKEIDDFLMIGK